RGENRLRRQHSRFDGGADALAALGVGETGGVADEQHAVLADGAAGMRIQQIRMSLEALRKPRGNPALLHQPAMEGLHVAGKSFGIFATEPHVDVLPFAKAPAVSLQILAEVELRPVCLDSAGRGLLRTHPQLDLLRAHRPLILAELGAELARHGAEMPAGADDERRDDAFVYDPAPTVAAHGLQRFSEREPRAAALEQVVIELATSYAV